MVSISVSFLSLLIFQQTTRPYEIRGTFFGEIALLTEDARRTAVIRAVTYVDCNVLERAAFEEVCEEFPEEAVHIHAMAEERLKREATTKSRSASRTGSLRSSSASLSSRTNRSDLMAKAVEKERDAAGQFMASRGSSVHLQELRRGSGKSVPELRPRADVYGSKQ